MDEGIFNKIFSAATGVWTLVLMAAVALFKAWPHVLGRFNERYRDKLAEEAGDWERIRAERDVAREERDLVRDRWAECQAELAAERAAHMELKAYHDGLGAARNEAQRILSEEREAAKKRHAEGNGK